MGIRVINAKSEINSRDVYLPGFLIEADCPGCGGRTTLNLAENSLTYPAIGKWEPETVYCDHCEDDFEIQIKLTVQLEAREAVSEEA